MKKLNNELRTTLLKNVNRFTENYDNNINILNDIITKIIRSRKDSLNSYKIGLDKNKNTNTHFPFLNMYDIEFIPSYLPLINNYYTCLSSTNKLFSDIFNNSFDIYEKAFEQFSKTLESYFFKENH